MKTAKCFFLGCLLATLGCSESAVKRAAESVYQQCGRMLEYETCEPRMWKNDHALAGRFMGYFGEQEVILGMPLAITYHNEEYHGVDGKGPYVETLSTLEGSKGRAKGTLRFAQSGERWLMTQFKFEAIK